MHEELNEYIARSTLTNFHQNLFKSIWYVC